MTTGSGDSRTLGGVPFGDAASSAAPAPASRTSTAKPGPSSRTGSPGGSDGVGGSLVGSPPTGRPLSVGTAPVSAKKGRRARLTLKRIDPWTTLKFSFVYGLAAMVVLIVSVIVLYGVVDAMGVISSVRSFIGSVGTDSSGAGSGAAAWLGFGRVMLVTIVIGLVNVVLLTAFATLTAFIYNVCTDLVGGIEVTLAERN